LHLLGPLYGVELPIIALFEAASPFVPSNDNPTWFGRAPLHAAAISCCVLPFAKASTRSLRVSKLPLPPAGFAAAMRRRPRDGAGAAALIAVIGILAAAVFLARVPLL
jgi:hypothetical protein